MSDDFLDTNVLVYAFDRRYPDKEEIAREILRASVKQPMSVSPQVLAEFTQTLLHKHRLPPGEVEVALRSLQGLKMVSADLALVHRALSAHDRYGIHFYDGLIVAAAERAGCKRILSEDLNPGQSYFGVRVENPFAKRPRS